MFFLNWLGGPWMVWLAKIAIVLEVALLSRDWARHLVGIYHSGPLGEAGLAIAFGCVGYACLNGIFEGFDRGNVLGLVVGMLGVFLLTKGFLVLFAPHYLSWFPI
jgi:hypothetical protein